MKRFKSIILPMQNKNKSNLMWLYNDKCHTDLDKQEKEKIFSYHSMKFWFDGATSRTPEKLFLYIEIPFQLAFELKKTDAIPIETYLLNIISSAVNGLNREYANINKNTHEKPYFEVQAVNESMIRRNGIHYDLSTSSATLMVYYCVPLFSGLYVNSKSAVRSIKDILDHIEDTVTEINKDELFEYIFCYRNQLNIREYLRNHDLCTFIANGSILPRESGTAKPMNNAVPFCSPEELQISIPLENGITIEGMGIKNGITIITGGGYSGKSTLLDAIESGIYNHIPKDGQEYVITDDSALKIYAEDGRPVHNLDLSPFFKYLPKSSNITNFSTTHASGSVSQAANIIEAVCGGSKLLLIDEDRSATNFMMRDLNMRKIVKNEPIIPFTDRVREIYFKEKVSTILVIGASSEYISFADCVILMDDYTAKDITNEISSLDIPASSLNSAVASWVKSRRLIPKQSTQPILFFRSVKTENEKRIVLDDYVADITFLTSIIEIGQMNTLACIMSWLMTDKESDSDELIKKATEFTSKLFSDGQNVQNSLISDSTFRWFEEIRPLDAFCCANRMQGLSFSKKGGEVSCNG